MRTRSLLALTWGMALCSMLCVSGCSRSHRGRHARAVDAGDAGRDASLDAEDVFDSMQEDAANLVDAGASVDAAPDADAGVATEILATIASPAEGAEYYAHEDVPLIGHCMDATGVSRGPGQFRLTNVVTRETTTLDADSASRRFVVGEHEISLSCYDGPRPRQVLLRIRVLPVPQVAYVTRDPAHARADELWSAYVDAPSAARRVGPRAAEDYLDLRSLSYSPRGDALLLGGSPSEAGGGFHLLRPCRTGACSEPHYEALLPPRAGCYGAGPRWAPDGASLLVGEQCAGEMLSYWVDPSLTGAARARLLPKHEQASFLSTGAVIGTDHTQSWLVLSQAEESVLPLSFASYAPSTDGRHVAALDGASLRVYTAEELQLGAAGQARQVARPLPQISWRRSNEHYLVFEDLDFVAPHHPAHAMRWDGGGAVPLCEPGVVCIAVPCGELLVVSRGDAVPRAMRLEDGALVDQHDLRDAPEGFIDYAMFDGACRHMVYGTIQDHPAGGWILADLQTGETLRTSSLSLSPDGKFALRRRHPTEYYHEPEGGLLLYAVDEKPLALREVARNEDASQHVRALGFSPDSKQLLFQANLAPSEDLGAYLMELPSLAVSKVADRIGLTTFAAWNPRGLQLALGSKPFLHPATGRPALNLVREIGRVERQVTWTSPAGTKHALETWRMERLGTRRAVVMGAWMANGSPTSDLYSVELESDEVVHLDTGPSTSRLEFLGWSASADGALVGISDPTSVRLFTVPARGSPERRVTHFWPVGTEGWFQTPLDVSSRGLLFLSDNSSLSFGSASTGAVSSLSKSDRSYWRATLGPTGGSFGVALQQTDNQQTRFSIFDLTQDRIEARAAPPSRQAQIDAAGRFVLYANAEPRVLDLQNGVDEPVRGITPDAAIPADLWILPRLAGSDDRLLVLEGQRIHLLDLRSARIVLTAPAPQGALFGADAALSRAVFCDASSTPAGLRALELGTGKVTSLYADASDPVACDQPHQSSRQRWQLFTTASRVTHLVPLDASQAARPLGKELGSLVFDRLDRYLLGGRVEAADGGGRMSWWTLDSAAAPVDLMPPGRDSQWNGVLID